MNRKIYSRKPLRFHGTIPVFSEPNGYTDNYEQIASDHLASLRRDDTNPFIPEELWVQSENSTAKLVEKYSSIGGLILDVGVGLGRLLSRFTSLRRCGMDISFSYLEIAKTKGIEVCYAKIEDMPYREGLFDIVTCADVLEHVLDLNLCCAKILSVLKPGGTLIVRVPYREDLNQYLSNTYPYRYAHVRNFDEYSLRLLFERVFDGEFMENNMVGRLPFDNRRLKRFHALPKRDEILQRIFPLLKSAWRPAYDILLRMLYCPIEINIVIRKK